MTLGFAHELGCAAAALLAMLAVLLGGELPPAAWLLCLGPPLSAAAALRGVQVPAHAGTAVGVASVVLGTATVAQRGLDSAVLAATLLLLGLQLARLLVRRTPEHDLQAILLSLLLVMAGTVLNVGISYIVVLALYAVAVVWALSTRQLIAGMDDDRRAELRIRTDVVTPSFFAATAGVSLVVLTSAAVLFAVFPRVGFGELGAFLSRESRHPDAVGLGGGAGARGGSSVIARASGVSPAAFEAGLYLRGAVYDVVTLSGFSRTSQASVRRATGIELGPAPAQGRYEVTALPAVGDTLLSFGGVRATRTLSGGTTNPNLTLPIAGGSALDELKTVSPLRTALRYEVVGGFARAGHVPTEAPRTPASLRDEERARYLALPQDFDPTLVALAAQAAGPSPDVRARVDSVRRFLSGQFQYVLDSVHPEVTPIRDFLLTDRRGHCEYFAAAFALLLRSQQVPTRIVGGFQGGAWDDGLVVFQERHAHAWVEWWLDGVGWIVDDASPAASAPRERLATFDSMMDRARRFWDDMIIDYSLQDQLDSLSAARRGWRDLLATGQVVLLGGLSSVACVGVIVLLLRLRRDRRVPAHVEHPLARAILDAVSRSVRTDITAGMTVREAVARVSGPPALIDALVDALADYERTRFAGQPLDAAAIRQHRRALRSAVEPQPPLRSDTTSRA